MIVVASFSLISGWILAQFFKVAVIVPASGSLTLLSLAIAISLGETPLRIVFEIIIINVMLPFGYALGQTVFYVRGIMRLIRKRKAEGGHGRNASNR